MTVELARTNGKCHCEQDLDPCGHHLQVCQLSASFPWSYQIGQGFFRSEAVSIPGVKVVTTTAHGLPHEMTTRGKQPDALITVPQPPGLYGPLLYPTSITGTAGLTLDFTVIHPISRRGTQCTCDENALLKAHRAKVTKHHEWLQANNYWFVPVAAATSGALHPATLRLPYDFARLKTDAAEQHAVANSLRSPLTPQQLCQRRGATFARLQWELSCTASGPQLQGSLGSTGLRPMPPHYYSRDLGHGHGAGSGGLPRLPPHACSLPVSGVGLGLFVCGFLPAVSTVFRSAICECLSVYECLSLSASRDSRSHPSRGHETAESSLDAHGTRCISRRATPALHPAGGYRAISRTKWS
jgi:hypothetical protein